MREIKFRCWQKDRWSEEDNPKWEMIDAESLAFEDYKPLVDLLTSDEDSEIFMQYIGLKDKNGKEIYEGDRIKLSDITKEGAEDIGIIIWQNGGFWFIGKWYSSHDWHFYNSSQIEIIGNIYETN